MASRTLPGLALKGFWLLGEDNYKDEMDLNLLKLSVLVDGGVIDKVDTLPGAPSNGNVYVLDETAGGGNANKIAVRDNGAWVYFAPNEGWMTYNRTADEFLVFNGTEWEVMEAGLPDPAGNGGKFLAVKLDESGYELVDPPGVGASEYAEAASWRILTDDEGSDGVNGGWGEIDFYDEMGNIIEDVAIIIQSSSLVGFSSALAYDGNTSAGNGWRPDSPTTEPVIGSWIGKTFPSPKKVAGLMIWPINGDFDMAPQGWRLQYYDTVGTVWVDIMTVSFTYPNNDERYFAVPPIAEAGTELEALMLDLDPGVVVKREDGTVETAHTVNAGRFMGSVDDGGDKVYDFYRFSVLADEEFGTAEGTLIMRGASLWEKFDPPAIDGDTYKLTIIDGVLLWVLDTGGSGGSITDIDASANPNYPAGVVGDRLYVTVAGKVGGAAGKRVEVGDMVICKTNNAGGNEATVGANWFVVQGNISKSYIPHSIGAGFGPGPTANEIVFTYVFVENVQWADECVGSYAVQGTVTTATYNLKIKKNGADIGVVQFQSTPSIAFGITGSSPIDWVPGDVLTLVGDATPDATLANVGITFYGTRTG